MLKPTAIFCLALAARALALNPELNDLSAGNALGGREVLEALRAAETVTAQRVDEPPGSDEPGPRPELVELGPPVVVAPKVAAELKRIFGDASTYLAPPKQCRFRANVRYVFGPVRIVLCFGCGELEVWRDGRMVSFSPFDAAYAGLLEATRAVFPDDEFLAGFSAEIFEERVQDMRNAVNQDPPPEE